MPLEEALELGDHLGGADRAVDASAERQAGVLVDHVQDPQRRARSGCGRP